MRYFALFVILFSATAATAQRVDFQALLDSGKAEYKRQLLLPSADFRQANDYFENALRLQPNNTTARYFYGYSLDKLNSPSGETMDRAVLDPTIKASEQFEFINRIEPHYHGEMFVLDPYSKIQALWGSLAYAYLNKGKADSARWALREGKRRGGFLEPVLAFNQNLLNDCSANAVLITSGDDVTFPILYLQLLKNVRNDVTAIDASLLYSSWYPKYLKSQKGVNLPSLPKAVDTLGYEEWTTKRVTLSDTQSKKVFSWDVKPTYLGNYFLKGDEILLNIIKQTIFKRDIFYSELQPDSSISISLNDHLLPIGLVSKLVVDDLSGDDMKVLLKPFAYSIRPGDAQAIQNSPSAIYLLNAYRTAYFLRIYYYLTHDKAEAKALLAEMKQKFPEGVLLYVSNVKQYEEYIAGLLKE